MVIDRVPTFIKNPLLGITSEFPKIRFRLTNRFENQNPRRARGDDENLDTGQSQRNICTVQQGIHSNEFLTQIKTISMRRV